MRAFIISFMAVVSAMLPANAQGPGHDEAVHGRMVDPLELIQLDDARALGRVDTRGARVVECRFFGGLDVEETAAALGISTATVKRDWRAAHAWLAQVLG